MSIYRGPGGPGDAVNDASSEAIITVDAKNAALAAQTAAELAATNAAASQTSASNSASSAATQATNAANSASAANTYANNASTYASNSASSASTATTQAGIATTQASNAVASATASANSAISSAGSASTAVSAANSATSSASAAATSATNASNSAGAASTSATNAANSAASSLAIYGNTAAMNAAVVSASTSASTATTQASNASTSATQAAASAAAASAISLANEPVRHSVRPSLLLDFANTKQLDPRITFSRPTTASYYDGQTNVRAEENLFLYSQDFDNAWWVKSSSAVTANSTTAPDGTTTADSLVSTATSAGVNIYSPTTSITSTAGQPFVITVYAKANTTSYLQILPNAGILSSAFANFDLATGVVGTFGGSGLTTSITSIGSGWYRCNVIIASAVGTASYVQFYMVDSASAARGANYTGTIGNSFYLWGAQAEQRSSATAYTPTTTTAITNYITVLQTAASGVSRFDHNPTTSESLGLLIEEQRTNLLTYSSDYTNAIWSKLNSSITSSATVAPDGTQTAVKMVENSAAGQHYSNQAVTTTAVATTFSVYAKAAERSLLILSIYDSSATQRNTWFNLSAGTIGTTGTGITASITAVGNGWYRCVATIGTSYAGINQATISSATVDGQVSYAGNGWSGIYIWGAQLEAGSFATSYIPTVASQVTRSADSASMTGTNFSSWYRADEGTVYSEAIVSALPTNIVQSIVDIAGTTSNEEFLYTYNNQLAYLVTSSGSTQVANLITGISSNSTFKVSATYKVNDFASSLNAGTVSTDTSGSLPIGASSLTIGNRLSSSNYLNGTIKKLAYYPKRLSNSELIGLTTI